MEDFNEGSKPETMALQADHNETDELTSPITVLDSIYLSDESDTLPLINRNNASREINKGEMFKFFLGFNIFQISFSTNYA